MKLRWLLILVVFLAGCSSKHDYTNPPWNPEVPVKRAMQWMPISEKAGAAWGVDPGEITVAEGVLTHAGSGNSAPFTDFLAEATTVTFETEPAPKPRTQ